MAEALQTVKGADELKEWLRSDLFEPHLHKIYYNAVLPAQAAREIITRAEVS